MKKICRYFGVDNCRKFILKSPWWIHKQIPVLCISW